MIEKTITTTATRPISSPASEVWRVLRRFDDLSWALGQGVASFESSGSGVGMLRIVTAPHEGGRIVEKLTAFDETCMSLEYVIVEGGIPGLRDYAARAQVRPRGEGCEIEWDCRAKVDPEQAPKGQAILDALADRMAALFASQFAD